MQHTYRPTDQQTCILTYQHTNLKVGGADPHSGACLSTLGGSHALPSLQEHAHVPATPSSRSTLVPRLRTSQTMVHTPTRLCRLHASVATRPVRESKPACSQNSCIYHSSTTISTPRLFNWPLPTATLSLWTVSTTIPPCTLCRASAQGMPQLVCHTDCYACAHLCAHRQPDPRPPMRACAHMQADPRLPVRYRHQTGSATTRAAHQRRRRRRLAQERRIARRRRRRLQAQRQQRRWRRGREL
eukprot:360686-Chlamydomonas_euryale.AAC.6